MAKDKCNKPEHLRPLAQALYQLICIPYIYISHGFRLPDKSTYQTAVPYSLPFEGQWTVVNGGTDKSTSHSWGVPTQRYAYDFLILDEDGKSYAGDKADLQNYYCYGKNVLAPADGVVVALKDQYPDARTYGDGNVDHDIIDIRGNYVVIRHTDKEYSFIGHLLHGSVKVKKGQMVKRGEYIGLSGNSGNTSEPHVHFHVQDGKNFFSSAGLPISFGNIQVERVKDYHKLDPRTSSERDESDTSAVQRGYRVENAGL